MHEPIYIYTHTDTHTHTQMHTSAWHRQYKVFFSGTGADKANSRICNRVWQRGERQICCVRGRTTKLGKDKEVLLIVIVDQEQKDKNGGEVGDNACVFVKP